LLDDGDIESHPGPPLPKVNAILQFHNARERERDFQESRYQFSQPTYTEEDDIYSEPAQSEYAESEFSSHSSNASPFTNEMVIKILEHVGTAQITLLAQEQKHRISDQEPTLNVRQMSSQEIFDTANAYSTHAPTEAVNNQAQAAVQHTVDPTYMTILQELSVELEQHDNHEYEKIVFLFLKSMKSLLKNRGNALSFIINTLLQAMYNTLNAIVTPATLTPSLLSNWRITREQYSFSYANSRTCLYVSMSSFESYSRNIYTFCM
jgi:hypothetical protein